MTTLREQWQGDGCVPVGRHHDGNGITRFPEFLERRETTAVELRADLGGANAVLAAAPLDYAAALDAVARYAVPFARSLPTRSIISWMKAVARG